MSSQRQEQGGTFLIFYAQIYALAFAKSSSTFRNETLLASVFFLKNTVLPMSFIAVKHFPINCFDVAQRLEG